MLSPLQERIAGLSEAEDFALAGGAALIVRGDIDRKTRDLDFFGLSAAAVDHLVPLAEQALREAGLQVKRVQEGPGFARFVIEDDDDRTEVDLASDARLFPADQGPGFQILSEKSWPLTSCSRCSAGQRLGTSWTWGLLKIDSVLTGCSNSRARRTEGSNPQCLPR